MPRLSIIIPVLGDPIQLEDTLVSVLENLPAETEVVVALNQPYNDPYNLKDEVRFVLASPRAGLSGVVNVAVAESTSPIVHLLHGGVAVSPNWVDSVLPLFDDPDVAVVAPLVVENADPDRVVAAGVDYTCGGSVRRLGHGGSATRLDAAHTTPIGSDVLAGFYRRSALEAVGGFDERVGDAVASVDLALRLKRAGYRCMLEPQCGIFVDSASLREPSAFSRGWTAEWFFWRWAPAAGWTNSLLRHMFMLLGVGLMCLVRPSNVMELMGRMLGSMTFWVHRAHWRSLQHQAQTLVPMSAAARPHFARTDSVRQLETPVL